MRRGLVLGVDFGERRVGLAVLDLESLAAMPLRTIAVNSMDDAVAGVLVAMQEVGVERVVVGLPRRLDGTDAPGDIERRVGLLVERLRIESGLPVETEDERMTTALVESERRQAGIAAKNFSRDAAAAAAILDSYAARIVAEESSIN